MGIGLSDKPHFTPLSDVCHIFLGLTLLPHWTRMTMCVSAMELYGAITKTCLEHEYPYGIPCCSVVHQKGPIRLPDCCNQ